MLKNLTVTDPPSCKFLETNIKAEKEAIEAYMGEWARTDSLVLKGAFENLGLAEMHHLQMLEQMQRDLKCKD